MSNPTLKDLAYQKAITAISSATSLDQKIAILERLVAYVRKITVVKCADCNEPLEESVRNRCPKHVASAMATKFARDKAREHGPKLALGALNAVNDLIEKHLGERSGKSSSAKPEGESDATSPDLEFNP